MRGYWLGVLSLGFVVWACGSDGESGSGGNGGSAGSAGTNSSGGSGGSSASGGSAGTATGGSGTAGSETGGSGGTPGDAGMEAAVDVYVYEPCQKGCERVLGMCGGTAMDIEECATGCTSDSLGACGAELKALIACVETSTIVCDGTNWTPVDCGTEFQTFQTCSDAQG